MVGPSDPDYAIKLRQIRRLLSRLPTDEVAVFQDEVDLHLNPKIGPCWMLKGQQATVETPGNNIKRHLAGSLVWRTGTLLVSPSAKRRNAALFVAHLDDLRRRLRGYRRIHVICDNVAVSQLPHGTGVSRALGTADSIALLAEILAGNQSHRTRVVAFARNDYP